MNFCLVTIDGKYVVLSERSYSLLQQPHTVLCKSEKKCELDAMARDLSTEPKVVVSLADATIDQMLVFEHTNEDNVERVRDDGIFEKLDLLPEIEDPYYDPEFSDDNYVPDSDDESLSSEGSATYLLDSKFGSQEKLKNVRRSLFDHAVSDLAMSTEVINEDVETSISLSTPLEPARTSKDKSRSKKVTAKMEVVGDCVKLYAMFPLHSGCYKGIFRQNDGNNCYFTLLEYPLGFRKHVCDYKCDKTIVAQMQRTGMKYHLELNCCFPSGEYLRGNEMYMPVIKSYVTGFSKSKEENDVRLTAEDFKISKSKRHSCVYCSKIVTNISRHIKKKHEYESDVQYALQMEPNSKERREVLKKLRLNGDCQHNKKNEANDGDGARVILVRKPKVNCTSDSIHCDGCSGYFMRKNFSKHYRRCKNIPINIKLNLGPIRPSGKVPNQQSSSEDNTGAQLLLDSLRHDEVGIIVRNDPLLVKTLAPMYCPDTCRFEIKKSNASQQLRRMARVLIEVKKLDNEIKWWPDLLKPERYDLLTKGIRIVTGMENSSLRSRTSKPQLALQFGPILTRLINRLLIDTLKDEELSPDERNARKDELKQLLQIHEMDFKNQVSSKALTITNTRKVYKNHDLPKPTDIHRLTNHLINLSKSSFDSLKQNGFDHQVWRNLGESLLCQIVVFNRRRTGEVSKMLLEYYYQKKDVDESDYEHLTRLQILLAKRYSVIYIAGKRVRPVPILLNRVQQKQLDLFIELRGKAGFTDKNPHLFPNHSRRDPYVKATICLRKFSEECGAENPKLLTGSYLRRQVATVSQYLSLSDNEIQELADFMGHDVNVHKKHYRQPSAMLEITKMSRFFSVVGDTNINRHKGKTLDELEIPPEDFDADDMDNLETELLSADSRASSPVDVSFDEAVSEIVPSSPPITKPAVPNVLKIPQHKGVPSKNSSQKQTTPKKPLTHQILTIVHNQVSPHAYRKKRIVLNRAGWKLEEKEFMKLKFGHFFKKDVALPTKDYINKVLEENPGKLQSCRTADNMYAYIQNQKRKISKPTSARRPGRPTKQDLAERAEDLEKKMN